MIKTSLVLCTYNRSAVLSQALESIAASRFPSSVEWEVLVVDNNSRDQTRQVVDEFCKRFPGRFRYLLERQQGLSFARNAGIREARGEIIAFTDDDVTVDPDWLCKLTAAFEDGEWAGAGGRIRPQQSFSPPRWLLAEGPRQITGTLVLFDLGEQSRKLDRPPFGANMAFRRFAFEKYGNFRTDLGHCGDDLIGNEETEFCRRLMRGGENLRYEPAAIVYHPVTPERLTRKYFLQWYFAYGRANARQNGAPPTVWGIPENYLAFSYRTFRWIFTANPSMRFYWKVKVWMTAGEFLELHRQSSSLAKRQISKSVT
jgi:glycosyltransferase involved in cell wall biosynthesis